MANVLNLLSEETFAEKMDTQNALLAAIAGQGGGIAPKSWSDIQSIVRLGLAEKVFAIGDQIACQKGGTTLVWDIIGIDHDVPTNKNLKHSITLQLHDGLASMQFDAREALFCIKGTAMPAGTYHFTVTQHTLASGNVGKTFRFTLTNSVPVGGQIVLNAPFNGNIAGSTVSTYGGGTGTTPIETADVIEGSEGTDLGEVDYTIRENQEGWDTNSLQRGLIGSSNYAESAIRQYLNSGTAAGSVWTPQTKFDRPPSWATTTAGFLSGMDEDFLAVIGKVDKITALNTVSDGGGSEMTPEKFFLLSRSEVYGGNENSIEEGAAYPYYAENSDLSSAGLGNDGNRIKYRSNSAHSWWLRTPTPSSTGYARGVTLAGAVSYFGADNGYGVVPACCIV